MSAVLLLAGARKTPKLAGGWASRSTSVFRETIWSRASRSVAASRSLLAAVLRASGGRRPAGVPAWRCRAGGRRPAPASGRARLERTQAELSASPVRSALRSCRSGHDTPPCAKPYPGSISAVRCNPRHTRRALGDVCVTVRETPGASRRAKIRKPVWPTMACWGRTASPSACQPRSSVSVASGSVKPVCTRMRLHRAGQLGGGGDVAAEHPAGHQHVGQRRRRSPRARACPGRPGRPGGGSVAGTLDQIADPQLPGRVGPAEEVLDVAAGDRGEVLAALVGDQPTGRSDRAQQVTGQRTRADPGLEHPGAGEDVGADQDLGRVLGVDHGRPARHLHGDLASSGRSARIRDAARRVHHHPLGPADQVVVRDPALGGVERAAGGEQRPSAGGPSGRSG